MTEMTEMTEVMTVNGLLLSWQRPIIDCTHTTAVAHADTHLNSICIVFTQIDVLREYGALRSSQNL